ncbi:MAG: hypothetical protein QF473_24370 [Planctomycetota bacterium]|nr:hypothetical protein [Planctomycetota bacterium]MDP6504269.1 hypothetical protein [Planctomycetota bacterium]
MATGRAKYTHPDSESILRLNDERKELKCLGCGKTIITDRCHRFCLSCKRRNKKAGAELRVKVGRIGSDGFSKFRWMTSLDTC